MEMVRVSVTDHHHIDDHKMMLDDRKIMIEDRKILMEDRKMLMEDHKMLLEDHTTTNTTATSPPGGNLPEEQRKIRSVSHKGKRFFFATVGTSQIYREIKKNGLTYRKTLQRFYTPSQTFFSISIYI